MARGVTAWARLLNKTIYPNTPAPAGADDPRATRPPDPTPDLLAPKAATQLVHALAGLAVALAGT